MYVKFLEQCLACGELPVLLALKMIISLSSSLSMIEGRELWLRKW
jgi:hypothetical protein